MSYTTLNSAQKAFEFADKLKFFYEYASIDNKGVYAINTLLLEYFGTEKYKEFCRIFRSENFIKDTQFFLEDFANNPVASENILFDWQIKKTWTWPTLAKSIMKVL